MRHIQAMHYLLLSLIVVTACVLSPLKSASAAEAIAMHGKPALQPGFTALPYADADAPKGGDLRLSHIGTFDSLNPYIIHGVAALGRHYVFESLMFRSANEPFTLYGLLAERVEVADDRSWVAFYLNPKAKFSDGKPVTVDDVIYSMETLRDHGRPNHHAYYSQVTKTDRVGEHGVRFSFANGDNRELPLIMGLMPVLPKHFLESHALNDLRLQPIPGSGAYQIGTVEPGRRVIYSRNPDYWGKDLPVSKGRHNFDRVIYDYYRDRNAAHEAFKAGDVDFQLETNPQRWATGYDRTQNGPYKLVKASIAHGRPSGMKAFVFNTRRKKFQDINVRKALVAAFDFNWLNKNLFHSAYTRTVNYFGGSELEAPLTPGTAEIALDEELSTAKTCDICIPLEDIRVGPAVSHRQQLMKAVKLLAQAGWKVQGGTLKNAAGEAFTFEILLADPTMQRVAQQFGRDLSRLGIEVNVRLVDSAQYQERANTYDYDMMFYEWGQSLSPGNEQSFYWGSTAAKNPGTRNYMGVEDPVIDGAIDALVSAITREDLVTATRLIDRRLRAGFYVVPLYHLQADRVAYWSRITPAKVPTALFGYTLDTWHINQ
jgi:ABC-type oligopeptide transport system substrate-binding subunit